ncbi:site-specific integrase [Erythrobacter sp.]|uniref:tyrosine-type recombinase/integrase n=1 Tax=Erythrobacter sp. TaxID=1042 RepID=UPI001B04489F|nr:site-specific integrase [Erythrobacter sp.]MBO6527539.1 integrase arm-type DNA-binding domain-containing protein [Erythrobacter sp.]MBO6530219.1 integrase arm-type DNA-binding domain-containing protein [Erythrobacter sp.]
MTRLTKRTVEALKSKRGRDTFLWDSELRGFGVRVKPSGTKTFIIQYRNQEARTRRCVIGQYGVLTVEQARDLAQKKLAAVIDGADPSAERHSARTGLTIAGVCDWYLAEAEAGRLIGRNRRPIKASSIAGDRSRIELHIKPLIGNRVVSQLKLADIERLQGDIAAGRTARARRKGRGGQTAGGSGVAARAISTLRALLNHARRLGIIEVSPATGVRVMASQKVKRYLSAGEIRHLGKVMTQMEREGEHPTGLAAIRVMLLTGFRRMEVLAMHKAWVQPDDNIVRFPDTKSGPQIRVAGDSAMHVLEAQALSSHSRFIFPADWGDGHFIGVVRVLGRVCARAGLDKVTPHTLRHSFASMAAAQGFSELTISGLLGHAPRGVTQRYVHLDTALIIAADQVAAEIARLLDGGELQSVREIKQARTLAALRAVA